MSFPQNNATNVPAIKKGPNGTSDFIPFFLKRISAIPATAPAKNAANNATAIFGQPKNKPIHKASFTSPKPMARPLDKAKMAKKNKAAAKPETTNLKSQAK